MTSNDAPHPGRTPRAGRRRALGRGPGSPTAPPATEETPSGTGPSGTTGARNAEPAPRTPDLGAPPAHAGASTADPGDPAPDQDAAAPGDERPPKTPDAAAPGADERPPGTPDAAAPAAPGAEPDEAGDGVFKVRLANFEGPFDLLLQLISKHKMDVTEVALSKVTDEFMAHIRAMGPDWDLDQTTEFLVVAATLLDLKAARLLPAAEVEDEADLALLEARDLLFARLLQYRAYKQIAEIFNDRLAAEARRYPRTVGLEAHHAELLPEVVISIGPEGFAKLAVKAMQPKPKPQVYVEHIHAPLVSVQEQAGIVVARLRELGEASFRVLVQDTEDTLTVVARFLALLELYREKAVELDQETALGDLLVRWTGGDGETQPVVTDEFDRPPETPKEEQKA
ncbi:ScpA family protein [Streptomyces sp. HUAS CX7]|uniref:segregation and condensation protein A n=1 Tax=Streptomyces sp. HUAS CX7 TaxID=3062782 RepID=UPI0026EE295C|nr:segregation/condensation protein A [Streptomyces sp. HUAS CX7]WKX21840.1 segregation/condensation protein A [Streptomyces sp. HUAS CX7]